MLFEAIRRRRRQQLLAEAFPQEWLPHLTHNVALFHQLTAAEQGKLQADLRVFVAEKHWEGCGGLTLTDEMKVTIAAHACLLILSIEHDYYSKVQSVLVYPAGYVAPATGITRVGVVDEGGSGRLGEAWYRGPVILSWEDAKLAGQHRRHGHNVVLHEFAHEIDMMNREADGVPPMKDRDQYERWEGVMSVEYQRLVQAAQLGIPTFIDPYGATNRAEFFAVLTECFFERPVELRALHPQIYELLSEFYNQDPARRLRAIA